MRTSDELKDLAADLRLAIEKINHIKPKLESEGFTVSIFQDSGKGPEMINGILTISAEREIKEKLL